MAVAYEGHELELDELMESECEKCGRRMDWRPSEANPAVRVALCCDTRYTAVPMLYQITHVETIH